MSHSQFHCTGRAYLDMHGLIFETSICYWQDQPGRSAVSPVRDRERDNARGHHPPRRAGGSGPALSLALDGSGAGPGRPADLGSATDGGVLTDRPTDSLPAGAGLPPRERRRRPASRSSQKLDQPRGRADTGERRRQRRRGMTGRRGAGGATGGGRREAPPTGLTPPPTTPRPHQPTSPQPGGQRSGAPDTARSPTPRESQPEKPAGETGTTGRLDVATASRPHAPTSAGVAGDGARAREPGPEPRPRPRTTSQPPPHHSPPGWDSGSQARGRWSRGARDSGARDDPLHPGPAGNRQAPAEEERGRRGRGQSPGPRRSPHTHNGGAQPMPSRPYNFATQDGAEEPADRGLRKSPHAGTTTPGPGRPPTLPPGRKRRRGGEEREEGGRGRQRDTPAAPQRPDLTDLNPRAHAPLRQADPPAATPPATAA